MRRILLILILAGFAGCVLLVAAVFLRERLRKVNNRHNLEKIVTTMLPEVEGFERINVLSEDFPDPIRGGPCYYSRDYYSIGSSLPELEAIARYEQALRDVGWRGWVYHSGGHGKNALVSVSPWHESNIHLRPLVTADAQAKYQSIIVVRVDFVTPKLEGC